MSPKPGVSTMVRAIRTPSSSSSGYAYIVEREHRRECMRIRTDVDGLDLDALLLVRSLWAVRDLVLKDFRLAKGVHEGGTAGTGGTCGEVGMSGSANTVALDKERVKGGGLHTNDHDRELNTLLDLVSSASTGERHS